MTPVTPFTFPKNGASTPIPTDLRHRLKDKLCASSNKAISKFMRDSKHFHLGVDASQHLYDYLLNTHNDMDSWDIDESIPPHPFDKYTISTWVGITSTMEANMVEIVIMVDITPSGEMGAHAVHLNWGKEDYYPTASAPIREVVAAKDFSSDTHPTVALMIRNAKFAWPFVNAFRRMLAEPKKAFIGDQSERRKGIVSGRIITYQPSREVTINLDAVKHEYEPSGARIGREMPLYEYRGHQCHSRLVPGCDHDWVAHQPVDPKHGRWTCSKCEGRRWNRKPGERGNLAIGDATDKNYRIRKAAERRS